MTKKVIVSIGAAALLFGATVGPALANDHLADATSAPGASQRGFANPVVANPSGTSGAAARPGTVPGLGNPNAGNFTGTPSVLLSDVFLRSGHGNPVGP